LFERIEPRNRYIPRKIEYSFILTEMLNYFLFRQYRLVARVFLIEENALDIDWSKVSPRHGHPS